MLRKPHGASPETVSGNRDMYRLLLIIIPLFIACSNKSGDYTIFGVFCGECNHDCATMYQLNSTESGDLIFVDTTDSYFHRSGVTCKSKVNDEAKIQMVTDIVAHIPNELINYKKQEDQFGCPDCADGCGIYLELSRKGIKKSFKIDYQTENLTGGIKEFADYFKERYNRGRGSH